LGHRNDHVETTRQRMRLANECAHGGGGLTTPDVVARSASTSSSAGHSETTPWDDLDSDRRAPGSANRFRRCR
jgi:hypothetical protein